ncbi:ROK family protein [Celerinatantimonas sp. YJH-8]|uniref:ROK family protein n=1 Tax=Celerinatantimonas sp. YJH-8 TaxID=3228714 RepID=UPI0038CBBD12
MFKPNQVICIDIGGSFIKLGVSTAPGNIQFLQQAPMACQNWNTFVNTLHILLADPSFALDDSAPLAISVAGIVDLEADRVFAGNIPAFQGHHIIRELSAVLGRKVYMANDVNCFTLAEATVGCGAPYTMVLGMILGTGIGGGLVLNGQIIQGRGGIAGEWGHAPIMATQWTVAGKSIELPRVACGCGQTGCVESYGSARGIERLHQTLHQRRAECRAIVSNWHQGDLLAAQTIDLWLQIVSESLALVVNTTGVDLVIAGGGLANDAVLISALDRQLRSLILLDPGRALVVVGQHSQYGGLIGASMLVWNEHRS